MTSAPKGRISRIDVRGLEPPEPMEHVLDALLVLPAGDHLQVLLDREPRPLYRILDTNGYKYSTSQHAGAHVEILIWHNELLQ